VIQHALGQAAESRRTLSAALALNPRFSRLHAERAERILRGMS
jgi:hypothetical protein